MLFSLCDRQAQHTQHEREKEKQQQNKAQRQIYGTILIIIRLNIQYQSKRREKTEALNVFI